MLSRRPRPFGPWPFGPLALWPPALWPFFPLALWPLAGPPDPLVNLSDPLFGSPDPLAGLPNSLAGLSGRASLPQKIVFLIFHSQSLIPLPFQQWWQKAFQGAVHAHGLPSRPWLALQTFRATSSGS